MVQQMTVRVQRSIDTRVRAAQMVADVFRVPPAGSGLPLLFPEFAVRFPPTQPHPSFNKRVYQTHCVPPLSCPPYRNRPLLFPSEFRRHACRCCGDQRHRDRADRVPRGRRGAKRQHAFPTLMPALALMHPRTMHPFLCGLPPIGNTSAATPAGSVSIHRPTENTPTRMPLLRRKTNPPPTQAFAANLASNWTALLQPGTARNRTLLARKFQAGIRDPRILFHENITLASEAFPPSTLDSIARASSLPAGVRPFFAVGTHMAPAELPFLVNEGNATERVRAYTRVMQSGAVQSSGLTVLVRSFPPLPLLGDMRR